MLQAGELDVCVGVPFPRIAELKAAGAEVMERAFGPAATLQVFAKAPVPGDVVCKPTAPQTGWWWNPAEDGRGFSVEVHGNNIFFAGFLYDASGRSTWHVATGPASMDGSYYTGPLYAARGGPPVWSLPK